MIEGIYQARVSGLLEQLKNTQARAELIGQDRQGPELVKTNNADGFVEYVQNAVRSVNDVQLEASGLRDAYERGEDVPLTDVVLAMQKSSLAFEATLQVRNKLLKAYEDIKNMPV